MDKQISDKLDSLLRYVPFIEFILKLDGKKYAKFKDIKKWILNKKRYPISDLNRIEQSITQQYKNLIVINDKKIPQEIVTIFLDASTQECVNLCSDDEESDTNNINSKAQKAKCNSKVSGENKESFNIPKESNRTNNQDLNSVSAELLKQIDQISDKSKCNIDRDLLQKCTSNLIKRNDDFETISKNPLSENKNEEMNSTIRKRKRSHSKDFHGILIDTISLDSSDEESSPSTVNTCKERELNANISTANADNALRTDKQTNPKSKSALNNKNRKKYNPNIKSKEKNSQNYHQHAISAKNSSYETNNESQTSSFDASSVQNLSIEDLLNHVSKINENKNLDLEYILLKSILTHIHNASIADKCSEQSKKNITNALQQPISSTNSITRHPYNFQIVTNHPKLKELRIMKWFSKFKNSPLLTSVEKEMTVELINLMSHVDDMVQPTIIATVLNKTPLNKQSPEPLTLTEEQNNLEQLKTSSALHTPLNKQSPKKGVSQSFVQNNNISSGPQTKERNKFEQPKTSSAHQTPLNKQSPTKCVSQSFVQNNNISSGPQTKERNKFEQLETSSALQTPLNNKLATKCISQSLVQNNNISSEPQIKERNKFEQPKSSSAHQTPLNKLSPTKYISQSLVQNNISSEPQIKEQNQLEQLETSSAPRIITKDKNAEVQLPTEKQKAEERKINKNDNKRRRILDDRETRNSLLNILQPYEEQIVSMWELHKNPKSININVSSGRVFHSEEKQKVANASEKNAETHELNENNEKDKTDIGAGDKRITTRINKSNEVNEENKKSSDQQRSEKHKIDRMHRVFKELECTFKGYDQLPNCTPGRIGIKRRSSVHARTIIAEQFNTQNMESAEVSSSETSAETFIATNRRLSLKSCTSVSEQTISEFDDSLEGSECSASRSRMSSVRDSKRRSSVYARSAIAEQLYSESHDSLDNTDISNFEILSVKSSTSKRRKNMDEESMENPFSAISEQLNENVHASIHNTNTPSARSCTKKRKQRIYDSDSESDLSDFENFRISKLKETIIKNQPWILLTRLTDAEIRKHTNQSKNIQENKSNEENILNVHLVESRIQPDTIEFNNNQSSCAKIDSPKKLNNDSAMTENNTIFCSLCSSRPSDLTNHYIRKHKSESYVSRLTWSQLHELSMNTPFAKLLPNSNNRSTIYSVKCPFCDKDLNEPFLNLYKHYSTHTGEYAFQCSGCKLDKPFKADIQSHQLHSKICRSSRVQTMYLYPSNAMTIYLHYCKICHFVQLNEANVLRHLRDHHDQRQAISHNVDKCILVAVKDADCNEQSLKIASSCNNYMHIVAVTNKDEEVQRTNDSCNGENYQIKIAGISKDSTNEVAVTELDFKLDDDIPVRNEACSEKLLDSTTNLLEEELKQMHEDEFVQTKPSYASIMTPPRFVSREFPNKDTIDLIEISDNCLTPLRPSLQKLTSPKSTYRFFPSNVKYMGLYKCLADDCYYSTDSSNEMLKHLGDHDREKMSGDYIQCAYCCIFDGTSISAQQLVDHIKEKHIHMIYQCSVCCYRSCEASNVFLHQKECHARTYQTCKVYKGLGNERLHNSLYIKEKIAGNVRKLQCQYCSHKSFYHSIFLEHHMRGDHQVHLRQTLKNYSCIYCPLKENDEYSIRKHIAIKHPGELPYVCDHNNHVLATEDSLHNLQAKNLAHDVPVIEINAILDSIAQETPVIRIEDVKPSAEELLRSQEEIIKFRLRKLTEATGVVPDNLYRCPEKTCGGFFSLYDLWLRHMRIRHNFCECPCPHCPGQGTFSLTFFKDHFEKHRRHTYICFHCPLTFGNKQDASEHASTAHIALGPIRFEQIRYNLSYSYFILVQTDILTTRLEFVPELLNRLNSRLKELEIIESKKLKRFWMVSVNSTPWLEDYKKFITKKLIIKCFHNDCTFRSTENDQLFRHARENHEISGTTFRCSLCDFVAYNCREWDGVLKHIKQHYDGGFFICDACSTYYYSRRKLSNHIKQEHAARDVPVLNLIKEGRNIHVGLSIVFANDHLSFSTLRNCFCCEERNMKSDAFLLHLKRYHKFVLNYFCEWCNLPIESLQATEEHYATVHTTNKIKIRCELTSRSHVIVQSLCNLKIHIDSDNADDDATTSVVVKHEQNNDDSIIILDDDDIVADNYVKDQKKNENKSEKPKLKCVPTANLLVDPSSDGDQCVIPRIKIVHARRPVVVSKNSNPSTNSGVDLTSQVSSNNNPPVLLNQHVTESSSRTMNHPLSSGIEYGTASCANGPQQRVSNARPINSVTPTVTTIAHPQQQVSAHHPISESDPTTKRLMQKQSGAATSGNASLATTLTQHQAAIPNITTIVHPQQQVSAHYPRIGNDPTTKRIVQNLSGATTSGNAPLSTTLTQHRADGKSMYSHPHEITKTYNLDDRYQIAHPQHQVDISSPRTLNDSTSNRMEYNQYEIASNGHDSSQRLQNGRPINFVSPIVTTTYQPSQNIAAPSSRNVNGPTANSVIPNQCRVDTSGSHQLPSTRIQPISTNIIQRHPNEDSIYSHSQIFAPVSQKHDMYSASPSVVSNTYPSQAAPALPHNRLNVPTSNSYAPNNIVPIVSSKSYLYCAPQAVSVPVSSPVENQNRSSVSSAVPIQHPQYTLTPLNNNNAHTPTNTYTQVMYSSTTVATCLNSGASGQNEISHSSQNIAAPSIITGMPISSTMGGFPNHAQYYNPPPLLPAPYGMANNIPQSTTTTGRVTNHVQHIVSEMRNPAHRIPAISKSRIWVNHPTQQMAVPSTMSGMTNHTGNTNLYQHTTAPPTSSTQPASISYAPTENNIRYQYMHAPMGSTTSACTNIPPNFSGSYTNPTPRY